MFGSRLFRRRLLVDTRRQLPFLLGLSLLAAANTLLALFALAWAFAYATDERIALQMNSGILLKVLAVLAVTSIMTMIWSLASTRNSLGLLNKVNEVLRQALNGQWPGDKPVRFRRQDRDFKELELCLQEAVARLDGRTAPLPADVLACLDRLEHDLAQEEFSKEEAAGCIRRLKEMVAQGESR